MIKKLFHLLLSKIPDRILNTRRIGYGSPHRLSADITGISL